MSGDHNQYQKVIETKTMKQFLLDVFTGMSLIYWWKKLKVKK